MGILEAIVVATIIIAAVYVGYNVWEKSLNSPNLGHDSIELKTFSFEDIKKPIITSLA